MFGALGALFLTVGEKTTVEEAVTPLLCEVNALYGNDFGHWRRRHDISLY